MSRVELYLGNCLEQMDHQLAGRRFSVVVTSPPYNLGKAYGTYVDRQPWPEYLAFMRTWARQVRELLAPDGSLFLNLGSRPSEPYGPFDVLQEVRQYLVLQNTLHWVKSISLDAEHTPTGQPLSVGHFKPINSARYVNDCHEYIFHFTREGNVPLDRLGVGVPYAYPQNATRWESPAGRNLRCRGNTWFIPYPTIQQRRDHPAPFPVELPRRCLQLHGVERIQTVLDPFMGRGTTGEACQELGVDFVGLEIDPTYFATARRTLTEAGKEAA